MSNVCALSTIDNPYNPFEDFNLWLLYDNENSYNTCEYLARIAVIADDMTQKEMNEEIERAIDEIIFTNPRPIYKKVIKGNEKQK